MNKQSSKVKNIIFNILKLVGTVLILLYLYNKGMLDFSRVHAVLTDIPVVITVFTIMILCLFASVIRWQFLLEGQGLPLQFKEAAHLTMIGVFFNTAIPGAVSGDVVKGYYVVRKQADGKGRVKAFTTLLLDRLLGLSALVFISFFAMIFNFNEIITNPNLKPFCGFITLIWIGVILFYAFVLFDSPVARQIQKIIPKLPLSHLFQKFFDAVKSYENSRHLMVKGFLISIAIHIGVISVFILLARSLGGFESVLLSKYYFLVPFGLLVTAIPVAPAGLGTGHAAFLGLFLLVGAKHGADLFTAFVSFQIMISLIGGLFYIRYKAHIPKTVQGIPT